MENHHRARILGRSLYFGIALLGVTAAGALAATSATVAAPAAGTLATSVSCSSSSACVTGKNGSAGPGVTGSSSKGAGVLGKGLTYGVYGSTTYTDQYGASSGFGVYGSTANVGGIGVGGNASGSGIGVYGQSIDGYGVAAYSRNASALYASTSTGVAAYLDTYTGYGLISQTQGSVAVYARNSHGNAADFGGTYIGIVGRAPTFGYPLVLTDSNDDDVFFVDGAGNVSYSGGLVSYARSARGSTVKSFSAKSTLPTVEDTGTAQLVRGSALVRLDPTFASSIETGASYRVFVTPNGDTRGLFVATKTAAGFVVRESQAGRSTVSFDYRIVATALGERGRRMIEVAPQDRPRAASPKVPVQHATSVRR